MSRRTVGGSGALARTRAAYARPRVRRKEFFFTKSRVAVHRAVVAGRRVAVVIIARRASRARTMSRDSLYERVASRGLRTLARSSDCRRTVRTTRRALASRSSRPRRRVRAPRVVATPPGGRLLFETLTRTLSTPHRPIVVRARAHRDAMTRVATRATPARATTLDVDVVAHARVATRARDESRRARDSISANSRRCCERRRRWTSSACSAGRRRRGSD